MNIKKIALLGGVGLASAAAGIAVPQMMSGQSHEVAHDDSKPEAAHNEDHATKGDHSGHDKKEAKPAPKKDASHGGGHEKKDTSHAKKDAGGHGKEAGGHGKSAGHGESAEKEVDPHSPSYLPFERMTLNINDPALKIFMNIEVAIQTTAEHADEVKEAMEARKAALKTWLTAHLADKTIEDLRGRVGVNRLRREIQDNFNSLLFDDGSERIKDILFEEFLLQ